MQDLKFTTAGEYMNNRIQEIVKQTAYIWHASGDPKIYEFTPEKLEKFVGLIVEECCTVLSTESIQHNGYGYNQHALYQKLYKHFGMEK